MKTRDNGFWGSKYFLVSGAIAAAILVGAAGAYQLNGFANARSWHEGCEIAALPGTALRVAPETLVEDEGRRAVVTYTLDMGAFRAGSLDACSPFGEVVIDPALGDAVEVKFTIEGAPGAVEETVPRVAVHDDGGAIAVGAWFDRVGEAGTAFGTDSARISTQVRLPGAGAWNIRAHSSAGDVRVKDVMAAELRLDSSFGGVVATGIDLEGDAVITTGAGDLVVGFASVQSGDIKVASDFGGVEIELPERADVGYDVVGETDFGEVTIRIGPTDEYGSEGGVSERETARSAGYDSKPTQVTVLGRSSSGNVRIVTSPTT